MQERLRQMAKRLFLLWWLIGSPISIVSAILNGSLIFGSLLFYGAIIITIFMVILIRNSYVQMIPPAILIGMSITCMVWFIPMIYMDARGVFTSINWLTMFFTFIDIVSFVFCLQQFRGNRIGVVVMDRIKFVDNKLELIWKRKCRE